MGDVSPAPRFLELPARTTKPRAAGITHVLDRGISPSSVTDLVSRIGGSIDIWKLGWGTAYLDRGLAEKVGVLSGNAIASCVGGTLLEIAWGQGRTDACLDWAADARFSCVEVSNGAGLMPASDKRRLIEIAAERFVVLAEVGSKDPDAVVSPIAWAEEVAEDIGSGASWVLTEGR